VKLDAHVLANHGIELAGCVHDTLLESYVAEVHERHELGMLAQRHCGWTLLGYDDVTGKGAGRIPFASVEVARATEFAAQRTDCALALHQILFDRIQRDDKLSFVYGSIEVPVLPVLWRMERNGVLLDRQKLETRATSSARKSWKRNSRPMPRRDSPSTSARPSRSRKSCSTG
jgi:DNA polymerase-1